jgi:hypothetical protein
MLTGRKRQQGVALLLLVAALAMGGMWYMVSRLGELSGNTTAANRARNAQVLSRAKQALIGYVIAQANHAGENNPGSLPCPEAPSSFNATNGTDGKMNSAGCVTATLPAVGRFPWRTLGTEQFLDASAEPLWYVVSAGWALTGIGANTLINSNSSGQLSVSDVYPASYPSPAPGDTVIALIIAPGPTIYTNCNGTPVSQVRSPTAGVAPDWRNYLECENATYPTADANFTTVGPSSSFNDQVIKVTVSDLMPGLEAAISNRINREIAPQLKTIYAATNWGLTGSNYLFPFAAPFSNPSTSAMQGSAGTYQGLLPMNYSETSAGSGTNCTIGASAPRCTPSFVSWSTAGITVTKTGGAGTMAGYNCSASTTTQLSCTITAPLCLLPGLGLCSATSFNISIAATAQNLGMSLRKVVSDLTTRVSSSLSSPALQTAMASTGNVAATVSGSLTPTCTTFNFFGFFICTPTVTVTVPITIFADHPLVDSTDATYGWFTRNKWHELTYYAVASGYSPNTMPTQPSCTTGTSCVSASMQVASASNSSPIQVKSLSHGLTTGAHVTIAGVTGNTAANGTWAITVVDPDNFTLTGSSGNGAYLSGGTITVPARGLLILAGRSLNGVTRPTATLSDYLDFANASADGTAAKPYERQTVTARIPYTYTDTGGANAYVTALSSVPVGLPFYFKAANANTGASTLNTTATGTKSIVNSGGSALSASQIVANAPVQVTYDGTQFILSKRPFNDRVSVIDSN